MNRWRLSVLARAAGADVVGQGLPETVATVGTDTRSLPPNCLFVALRGENFDGHQFLDAAVQAGAKAVVVDQAGKRENFSLPQLVVKDTLQALGDIANTIRKEIGKPVVAITGSNGKTTNKELVAAVLTERGEVHKTSGNLNNLVGVPLTLFAWTETTWAAVLEMGMNHPGEIARLCEIAEPNVGLITNVGIAHLGNFQSLEDVALAKAELFEKLPAHATAVINDEDEKIKTIGRAKLKQQKQVRFGKQKHCDVYYINYRPIERGCAFDLVIEGKSHPATLPLVGEHNALNASAAACVGWVLACRPEQILAGLKNVRVPGGRFRIVEHPKAHFVVVDDTYNANPQSMRAAFAALADVARGERFAVLGDMFELGNEAEKLHHAVGKAAAQSGIRQVFAVGPNASATAAGAREGGADAQAFASMENLLPALPSNLQQKEWILVKGSRGMRMERAVEALLKGNN